jgi:hypothetical protein
MQTIYDVDSNAYQILAINGHLPEFAVTTRDLQKARRSASRGIIRKPPVKSQVVAASKAVSRVLGRINNDAVLVRFVINDLIMLVTSIDWCVLNS